MKKFLCLFLTATMIFCCFSTPAFAKSSTVLDVNADNISHEVSENLYGIFIEDISYADDGGLVSNLVNNGSFEYQSFPEAAWYFEGIDSVVSYDDAMSTKNPTYETLTVYGQGTAKNYGFNEIYEYKTYNCDNSKITTPDMGFEEGVGYDFSCYFKNIDFSGTISVYLDSKNNASNVYEISNSDISSAKWTKLSATLTSQATEDGGLAIVFKGSGSICLDFVSLVPQNSYGYGSQEWKYTTLRSDLYNALKDLNPSFVRFPGGCLAEGNSLENLYSWKNTIGPLEERVQSANVWANDDNSNYYNNTSAMGYHEYFQLSEDLNATAIPVVNAGMVCQARCGYDDYVQALKKSSMTDEEWQSYLVSECGYDEKDSDAIKERTEYIDSLKINSQDDFEAYLDTIALRPGTDEFNNYAQDILDLIEYANGDATTTYWGALRSANGHEKPFNIKYIAVGNENWGDLYFRNFDALKTIINKAYPEITVITSSGTSAEGTYFDSAWDTINTKYTDTIVDEHYYTYDSYLYAHNDRYDSYDRDGAGVFIGEYASVSPGFGTMITKNNIYSAVEEASYMTSLERNSDIVKMASYAPTFAKINANSWNVNMIWFDSQDIVLTPNYYTQMLFSNNIGTEYIDTTLDNDNVYQSVTVDTSSQTIYIKLVNSSSSKQSVTVNLDGFDNINQITNQSISHKYKQASNELGKQTVAPVQTQIESEQNSFDVTLNSYSANVIRVAYGENDGTTLYQLPDTIDLSTKSFTPSSTKIAIAVILAIFGVSMVGGYFIYTRIINKNANPRRKKKK